MCKNWENVNRRVVRIRQNSWVHTLGKHYINKFRRIFKRFDKIVFHRKNWRFPLQNFVEKHSKRKPMYFTIENRCHDYIRQNFLNRFFTVKIEVFCICRLRNLVEWKSHFRQNLFVEFFPKFRRRLFCRLSPWLSNPRPKMRMEKIMKINDKPRLKIWWNR